MKETNEPTADEPRFSEMTTYDFKRYHVRSINAATAQERVAINEELKTLYASLSDEEKEQFNQQLQTFLTREVGRLKSDYESVNGVNHPQ